MQRGHSACAARNGYGHLLKSKPVSFSSLKISLVTAEKIPSRQSLARNKNIAVIAGNRNLRQQKEDTAIAAKKLVTIMKQAARPAKFLITKGIYTLWHK